MKAPTSGNWLARWGNWAFLLTSRAGRWDVIVWRWPHKTKHTERIELGVRNGFAKADLAMEWACQQMVADGAIVQVTGASSKFSLKDLLEVTPAPVAVSA